MNLWPVPQILPPAVILFLGEFPLAPRLGGRSPGFPCFAGRSSWPPFWASDPPVPLLGERSAGYEFVACTTDSSAGGCCIFGGMPPNPLFCGRRPATFLLNLMRMGVPPGPVWAGDPHGAHPSSFLFPLSSFLSPIPDAPIALAPIPAIRIYQCPGKRSAVPAERIAARAATIRVRQ